MLGLGLCLLLIAVAGAALAGAIEARHRAQIAADAAALAGAMDAAQGATSACERAGQLAAANNARVTDCRLSGPDITVEVTAALPRPLAGFGPIRSLARAGPVSGGEH